MYFLFIQLHILIQKCLTAGMQILIIAKSTIKLINRRYFTRQVFSINIAGYFRPRYRQANLQAFFTDDKEKAKAAFDTAYEDMRTAFIYYLKNYNNGRPIIIASHSQGTLHAGRLLKEFFEGKPLQNQLVCAYIIGLPVFTNYFSDLKPCEDSTATGCFVRWRTFEEGYISPYD